MELQDIKAEYAEIRAALNSLSTTQTALYRMMYALQKHCPHPIESVIKWERIPMGQYKGTCSCCGYDLCWYHEYSLEDQGTLQFV